MKIKNRKAIIGSRVFLSRKYLYVEVLYEKEISPFRMPRWKENKIVFSKRLEEEAKETGYFLLDRSETMILSSCEEPLIIGNQLLLPISGEDYINYRVSLGEKREIAEKRSIDGDIKTLDLFPIAPDILEGLLTKIPGFPFKDSLPCSFSIVMYKIGKDYKKIPPLTKKGFEVKVVNY